MIHVAVVNRHHDDAVGGSELQCDLVARDLVARGHRVTYVALNAEDEGEPEGRYPYTLVRLGTRASRDAVAVSDAVRSSGAQVVYWRYGRSLLDHVTRGLAELPAVPVVLAVAHVDDVSRWPSGPLVRNGVRALIADVRGRIEHRRSWRAFRDIAAVAAQRQDFLDRVPVGLQRHVPNVVDPASIRFDWPRPYVAWVANLKARKRPEQIAPLARVLATHGVDLLVAGTVQDERYRPLTSPDPEIPNLHPLGALAPAAASGLIAGARCLAVTARPEGLSNVMIQAWWHGVPTVSLDYDPDGSIAQHGLGRVCGGDEDGFRAAVVEHTTARGPRDASGRRAADYARTHFELGLNGQLLEELLATVVSSAGASRG